ncbi:hypothetical protein IRJ41_015547, partial [Triplophysa rosa]
ISASRYLRRSETPYEVSKCYRSRSPLTRSDQEVSPVSACKISGDEKRGCTVARKRKSDQQDSEHLRKRPTLSESQGPLKKPSHPPQLIAFSTPLPNMLSALGSAGRPRRFQVNRHMRRTERHVPSPRNEKWRNVKTASVRVRCSERKTRPLPPSHQTSMPLKKRHVSQKGKEDVRKSQNLQKRTQQPSKNAWGDSQRLPSYSTVQAQEKNADIRATSMPLKDCHIYKVLNWGKVDLALCMLGHAYPMDCKSFSPPF